MSALNTTKTLDHHMPLSIGGREGAQWLSGRVLELRRWGCGFNPGRTVPTELKSCLMGCKESNQFKQKKRESPGLEMKLSEALCCV